MKVVSVFTTHTLKPPASLTAASPDAGALQARRPEVSAGYGGTTKGLEDIQGTEVLIARVAEEGQERGYGKGDAAGAGCFRTAGQRTEVVEDRRKTGKGGKPAGRPPSGKRKGRSGRHVRRTVVIVRGGPSVGPGADVARVVMHGTKKGGPRQEVASSGHGPSYA